MNAGMGVDDTSISDHGPMPTDPQEEPAQTRPGRLAPFWQQNQPSVLIAAPDPEPASALIAGCRELGIRTELVSSGPAALISYGRTSPDAVVAAEDLPGLPAQDVADAITADSGVPVLIVVPGRDGGAPVQGPRTFSSYDQVLSSRVISVLAGKVRRPWPAETELRYGSLVMNTGAFEVSDNSGPLALTLREFEILRVLILAAGQAVSLDQLRTDVWGAVDEEVRAATVKVHLSRLRKKMTGSTRPVAVRGIGYALKSY
ncbi:response regulator transcription factor [Arthrobacter sp. BB-1]|uniref:winged helix-turn-helix transcriptional regulator n=1 Tax=unclassified Arthrobacter TaxID=235627 RepID=UPI0010E4059A|nr:MULTISPECIES: response regulator transcription factor [unclassified Arthrobacter]TNB67705.1 response regulator transcription factor [Arthrobacter sp. BB-1]VII98642.1 hypothetical protein [Arthrobacter sp. DR-2P]